MSLVSASVNAIEYDIFFLPSVKYSNGGPVNTSDIAYYEVQVEDDEGNVFSSLCKNTLSAVEEFNCKVSIPQSGYYTGKIRSILNTGLTSEWLRIPKTLISYSLNSPSSPRLESADTIDINNIESNCELDTNCSVIK